MPSDRPVDALEDILENIARIERFIGRLDEAAFCADDKHDVLGAVRAPGDQ